MTLIPHPWIVQSQHISRSISKRLQIASPLSPPASTSTSTFAFAFLLNALYSLVQTTAKNPTIALPPSHQHQLNPPYLPHSQSQNPGGKKRNSPKNNRQPRNNRPQSLTTSALPLRRTHNTNNKQRKPKHRIDNIERHVHFETRPFLELGLVRCKHLVGQEEGCFYALHQSSDQYSVAGMQ